MGSELQVAARAPVPAELAEESGLPISGAVWRCWGVSATLVLVLGHDLGHWCGKARTEAFV